MNVPILTGFEREFEVVEDVMRRTGKILLPGFGKSQADEVKAADGSPGTPEDRAASQIITPALEAAFPDYGILDEERVDDDTRYGKRMC